MLFLDFESPHREMLFIFVFDLLLIKIQMRSLLHNISEKIFSVPYRHVPSFLESPTPLLPQFTNNQATSCSIFFAMSSSLLQTSSIIQQLSLSKHKQHSLFERHSLFKHHPLQTTFAISSITCKVSCTKWSSTSISQQSLPTFSTVTSYKSKPRSQNQPCRKKRYIPLQHSCIL